MEISPVPKNIVLIGFMGSGKSSVGRIIAQQIGFALADTDHLVVQHTGLQITEIFKSRGEDYFRDQETAALHSLLGNSGLVISTGGGIILREENVGLLRELGCIVWLTASEEVLFERISRGTKRPLMQTPNPRETIHNLLSEREPLYRAAANYTVDTSAKTHEEVAQAIISQARRLV
ncbi:MAG TPA: shikimate kinase [Chthoniobacteraceae bacterium]|nr:shikimate kinase [Chthoniobacteraceae bacterium]